MLEVGRLRAADDMVEAARASVKVMVQGLMLASQRQWDTLARMRFLRLQLKNWKNFRAVDVSLRPRTFLVGPNAAGKSNLLDALRFLRDVAQPKGGGLLAAVDDLRPGFRQVRSLHARQESNVVVEVDVGNDDADRWRYRLELGGERNEPRNEPKIVGEQVWRGEQCLLERPNEDDRGDPARLRQTHLEQVSTNRPFRDLADFFAGVSYLHLVPQLLREPRRFEVVGRDPLGSDFLRRLADAPERQRKARLRRIQQALRVAVPNLRQLETKSDPDGTPHLRGQFEHWRPGTGWQNERQFSDGTLRLVALLWILAEGSEPLLLEEPELSLHPAIVREIPRMLHQMTRKRARQVLLSTHSADLLADEGIDLDEILLVRPGKDGSEVVPASRVDEIRRLLEQGSDPGEAVMPHAAPAGLHQLPLPFEA